MALLCQLEDDFMQSYAYESSKQLPTLFSIYCGACLGKSKRDVHDTFTDKAAAEFLRKHIDELFILTDRKDVIHDLDLTTKATSPIHLFCPYDPFEKLALNSTWQEKLSQILFPAQHDLDYGKPAIRCRCLSVGLLIPFSLSLPLSLTQA